MARLLFVLAATTLLAGPAQALPPTFASFGREGGNIIPFTVTITQSGEVRSSGPVEVGRTKLTAAQLAGLVQTEVQAGFSALPATTACPGTLPDIATTWIKAGSRLVRVHGSCSKRFLRVWNALAATVLLSYG